MVEIKLEMRPDVTGTLSPRFSELPDLETLDLKWTQVSGDIAALQNLTKLTRLHLGNTKVSGNLVALQNLRELRFLYLDHTQVIGDIRALENVTSLGDNFHIKGTKITCEEAALRAVLLKLGLQATQLTNLMNFEGVTRMLSCRILMDVSFFLHMIWRIKLDHA